MPLTQTEINNAASRAGRITNSHLAGLLILLCEASGADGNQLSLPLISGATAQITGSGTNLGQKYSSHTLQLAIQSGSLISFSATLEGSLDGSRWAAIGTLSATTDGACFTTGVNRVPFTHVRARITTLTGTAPVITLNYCGAA
jgi:hypothetical protein